MKEYAPDVALRPGRNYIAAEYRRTPLWGSTEKQLTLLTGISGAFMLAT